MRSTRRLLAITLILTLTFAAAALAASAPTVTTGNTTSIGTSSVVLNGSINPNGATTTYHFEWGLTTAYGLASTAATLKSGTTSSSVNAKISGLLPGTTYHYRLDASNSSGPTLGGDRTFVTGGNPPPGVTTGPAQTLGPFSASVTGVINPEGGVTTWSVQYGLSTAYPDTQFGGTIPAGLAPVTVSAAIVGLQPGTTFHYRLIAVHSGSSGSSTMDGADATFATAPFPPPAPRVTATTTPRKRRHKPFTFNTFGRVIGPQTLPQSEACSANAIVDFYLGRRLLHSTSAAIQPNCTFFAQTSLGHSPRRHGAAKLTVKVRFVGNIWLSAASARDQTVTLK
jgi:hypothetical protein